MILGNKPNLNFFITECFYGFLELRFAASYCFRIAFANIRQIIYKAIVLDKNLFFLPNTTLD